MNRTSILERESPWGLIPIADAHIHFFSHHFFEKLTDQKRGLTLETIASQTGWNLPASEPEKLAAVWAEELDRQSVAHAALISSVPGD